MAIMPLLIAGKARQGLGLCEHDAEYIQSNGRCQQQNSFLVEFL